MRTGCSWPNTRADARAATCPRRPRDAHKVEEAVTDAGRVEPTALLQLVGGRVPLVHERERRIVAGLHADGEIVHAEARPRGQIVVGLVAQVADAHEAADAAHARQALAHALEHGSKLPVRQTERIRPGDEHPLGARPKARKLFDVGIDLAGR